MFSLAAINYRDIFTTAGGPIERISSGSIDVLGKKAHQANAYLAPGLIRGKPSLSVYGNADGTGASGSAQVARHMAISEALERWAFYELSQGTDAAKYGFDHDNSTNGMAAFPGFFKGQARKRAYYEALERWALVSGWSGSMRAAVIGDEMLGVTALRLEHSADFGEVAILFRRSAAGHVSYGYSAGSSFKTAVARDRKPHRESAWSVRFDGELPGPWSRYATVWRVVADMPSRDYLNPKCSFFFW